MVYYSAISAEGGLGSKMVCTKDNEMICAKMTNFDSIYFGDDIFINSTISILLLKQSGIILDISEGRE